MPFPRLALVALLAANGCQTQLGSMPLVGANPDALGVKMLRPAIEARSCRASVLGIPLQAGEPAVDEAFADLLRRDEEGNVLTQAELREERLLTGIYNRRCLVLRGDLGRLVSTVTLPMPDTHEHHGAH